VSAAAYFSAEELQRTRRYERPQLALHAANSALSVALLAVRAGRGGIPLRRQGAGAAARDGAALSLALNAVALPIGALARKRSLDAGLATQSWPSWTFDLLRTTALASVFAGSGAAATRALIGRFDDGWWVVAAAGSIVLAVGATFAAPVLLDPIFNDFEPLPAGELRSSVLEIAGRAGVRIGEVFTVDASRRTTAANAYVGGLGATRRIVLFDTLIANFSAAETVLVVAHELAHVRHRDVVRGLVFAGLAAPLTTLAVARLAEQIDTTAGAEEPTTLAALVLAGGIVGSLVGTVARQLSRAIERRADAFALELTDDPDAFIAFERQITLANLVDPEPPRWRSLLYATHPPAVERIGAAAAYKARR